MHRNMSDDTYVFSSVVLHSIFSSDKHKKEEITKTYGKNRAGKRKQEESTISERSFSHSHHVWYKNSRSLLGSLTLYTIYTHRYTKEWQPQPTQNMHTIPFYRQIKINS